jgi:hypothetical protein
MYGYPPEADIGTDGIMSKRPNQSFQKFLKRSGAMSVYRTVCMMFFYEGDLIEAIETFLSETMTRDEPQRLADLLPDPERASERRARRLKPTTSEACSRQGFVSARFTETSLHVTETP